MDRLICGSRYGEIPLIVNPAHLSSISQKAKSNLYPTVEDMMKQNNTSRASESEDEG